MPETSPRPNPFLPTPPPPAQVVTPAVRAPQITGPSTPQRGVPAPEQVLPLRRTTHAASLWLLGVHGGAGESTLAALSPHWRAAGHAWPLPALTAADAWGPTAKASVVLVARTHAHGLRSAQFAAQQWASGQLEHVQLQGLVVIADAPGRLPKPLAQLLDVVAGGVPRLWRLPWVEEWRLGATLSRPKMPGDVRSVVNDLRALSQPTWGGDPTSAKDQP